MAMRYSHVPPGGGQKYDWSADHTFVKVSAGITGDQYSLLEDKCDILNIGPVPDQPQSES
ncbi:hypothetical protein DEA8626_02794 [Defluviimonas aquaemixtae]|uniref:Uncharacterized protein n=1 Tax=Albidovulum aquaemixtae TaxID=1542388 RepID=A0A2R8BK20_9RHOB|nr:hypothetical protein [Defluviimonas aquaemixtae]SPH23725.1 hypothetical protein DEA8626_02794 [Defluviimonas aquaemixtae]